MSQALAGIVADIAAHEKKIAEETTKLAGIEDREEAAVSRCRIHATETLIAKLKFVSGEIVAAQQYAQEAEKKFAAWRAIVAEIRTAYDRKDKITRDLASDDEEVRKLGPKVETARFNFQKHADSAPGSDFALMKELEKHREKATQLEKERNDAIQKLRDATTRQARLQMELLEIKKKIGDLEWRAGLLRPKETLQAVAG